VQAADLIQTAEQDGRFNGFLQLLEVAGMVEVLEGEGPFTVFAPVDEAFSQLPPGVLEWLLAEETGKALEAIVQSHIVPGAALLAEDLLEREVEVETLGGTRLAIGGTAGMILVVPLEGTITEVEGRVEPKSGAIPASAIVVEAPQNAVAGANPATMLTEQELTAVATVLEPDIEADNGVIHGIDLVLLPPEALRSF
jgi:transforming growth factor-beta-induced protein